MKRVRSVGDTRGCERLMRDVMTVDEESVVKYESAGLKYESVW